MGAAVASGCAVAAVRDSYVGSSSPAHAPFLELIAGLPQAGPVLGSQHAPVTATLYGDLECPICRQFVLGRAFARMVARYVRPGQLRVVYRSLETATASGASTSWWVPQQVAALAAGRQDRFWQFTMLFLHNQPKEGRSYVSQAGPSTSPSALGPEGSGGLNPPGTFPYDQGATPPGQDTQGAGYVNEAFLDKVAREVPGLRFAQWKRDRGLADLARELQSDEQAAARAGFNSTPTIVFRGPRRTSLPVVGPASFAQLQRAIAGVS